MSDKTDAKASSSKAGTGTGVELGFTPLYLQVRQKMLDKIIAGTWQPGTALPSEQQLALQMGVSQGTLRKALDALASDRVIVRHQGRGTFVAEHDQRRTLFQFFKIASDSDGRMPPETLFCQVAERAAESEESQALQLAGDKVWHIHRHRALRGRVLLLEDIMVDRDRFPALDDRVPLPNNIYELYERHFAITVAHARERLKAISANEKQAELLGCDVGHALLQIERTATALNGSPIEFRRTLCLTDHYHYSSDLR
ncbi:GntR family transcriptional regulator [Nitratireductor basaltis]|uniref:GntR family transcriptional regulator n=1 Tax=Nitratireductor basaltis TaxID=472175 RepID=A0A084UDW2_9HYPH|nr:GntR family transcriptional regulator [Nitratireductor basaltis]KFB11148.1 GntR family transcriptional regulator [Nitratireductor basaltis]